MRTLHWRKVLFMLCLAVLLFGCARIPTNRIVGVTRASEFPSALRGWALVYTKDDAGIFRGIPTERIEFKSAKGDTLYLYTFVMRRDSAYGDQSTFQADVFYTFQNDVYQSENGWYTAAPTDNQIKQVREINSLVAKLGQPRFAFDQIKRGESDTAFSSLSVLFFEYSDGFLLVSANPQGSIAGTRQLKKDLFFRDGIRRFPKDSFWESR